MLEKNDNFKVGDTNLNGLKILSGKKNEDSRGYLSRIFCKDELCAIGWSKSIAQVNHTLTTSAGTVRGMHYQIRPFTDDKLITCIRGSIWDVALDLRANSPTFLQWYGLELSAKNKKSLYIPEGFAHGFQSLEDYCELIYCHSEGYTPEYESGINPLDPMIDISWPREVALLSERDQKRELLTDDFKGL
jgi:dTDP-4-dehydrorhamnose 3,5-epimerase